jgi:hypothetical protein
VQATLESDRRRFRHTCATPSAPTPRRSPGPGPSRSTRRPAPSTSGTSASATSTSTTPTPSSGSAEMPPRHGRRPRAPSRRSTASTPRGPRCPCSPASLRWTLGPSHCGSRGQGRAVRRSRVRPREGQRLGRLRRRHDAFACHQRRRVRAPHLRCAVDAGRDADAYRRPSSRRTRLTKTPGGLTRIGP